MKARISQLHRTEAEWQKLTSWIPEPGELIIYDPVPCSKPCENLRSNRIR